MVRIELLQKSPLFLRLAFGLGALVTFAACEPKTTSVDSAGNVTVEESSSSSSSSSSTQSASVTSGASSSISALPATMTCSSTSGSWVTVQLRDSSGKPVPTRSVALTSSRTGADVIDPPVGTTNNIGIVRFKVKSTLAGLSTFKAYDNQTGEYLGLSSQVTFVEGAPSASSVFTSSAATLYKGQTVTLTLTMKDEFGQVLSRGGAAVSFSKTSGAGVSGGTIGTVTDHNDGTYTAIFTATQKGTASTFTATIGSGAAAFPVTQTVSIQVLNTAPVLTLTPSHGVFPLTNAKVPITLGETFTITSSSTDTDGDSVTYSCAVQSVDWPSTVAHYRASGSDCNALAGLLTSSGAESIASTIPGAFNTTTGAFSWKPYYNQFRR